jgi:hypothetical protein
MTAISTWPHKVTEAKDPEAVLDYVIDWSDWLAVGEVLVDSTWAIEGDAVLGVDQFTDTTATAWVSGGTTTFRLTNSITTSSVPVPRQDQRTLVIKVKDK